MLQNAFVLINRRLATIPYLPYLYRVGLGFSLSIWWRRGVKILQASLNSSLWRQTMNVLERRHDRRAHYTGLVNVRYVRFTASLFYVMLRVSKAAHCLHLVWRAHMKHIQHATHRLCLLAKTWKQQSWGKHIYITLQTCGQSASDSHRRHPGWDVRRRLGASRPESKAHIYIITISI